MRIPDFSQYDGGTQFAYQDKIFHREKSLGSGSFAEVLLFETQDKTQRYAVKCEKACLHKYGHGNDFATEAKWYQTIYGLGVLSGNPKNVYAPHYILMPYFEGRLLHEKMYQSAKELFYYWMWSAMAICNLHQQHHVIHADLKFDNIIAGDNKIFLIDFGMITRVNDVRKECFYPDDKFFITHQPPELFFGEDKEKKASECQDVYCLGYLLRTLFYLFFIEHVSTQSELLETQKKVGTVTQNMTQWKPERRWSIEKSIYMLSVACLSQLPKEMWSQVVFQNMSNTSQAIFDMAIQVRIDELTREQKKLDSPSSVKEKKIDGLKKLQQQIAEK